MPVASQIFRPADRQLKSLLSKILKKCNKSGSLGFVAKATSLITYRVDSRCNRSYRLRLPPVTRRLWRLMPTLRRALLPSARRDTRFGER